MEQIHREILDIDIESFERLRKEYIRRCSFLIDHIQQLQWNRMNEIESNLEMSTGHCGEPSSIFIKASLEQKDFSRILSSEEIDLNKLSQREYIKIYSELSEDERNNEYGNAILKQINILSDLINNNNKLKELCKNKQSSTIGQ